MPSKFYFTLLALFSSSQISIAQETFTNHSSYQSVLPFGALLFNKDAISTYRNRRMVGFLRVTPNQNKMVTFPQQIGYCFFLNHYTEDGPWNRMHYTIKVTKTYQNGTVINESTQTRRFTPVDWRGSYKGPDWCVTKIRNVVRIDLEFYSPNTTEFDWKFWFSRRP